MRLTLYHFFSCSFSFVAVNHSNAQPAPRVCPRLRAAQWDGGRISSWTTSTIQLAARGTYPQPPNRYGGHLAGTIHLAPKRTYPQTPNRYGGHLKATIDFLFRKPSKRKFKDYHKKKERKEKSFFFSSLFFPLFNSPLFPVMNQRGRDKGGGTYGSEGGSWEGWF